MTITWEDSFFIAASKDSFSDGGSPSISLTSRAFTDILLCCVTAKFVAGTTVQPIKFGQTYVLPKDWTDTKPIPDPQAPPAGFRFQTRTEASVVVYKMVHGNISPIYISAPGPLPPGHEDLVPKAACRVWFAANVETQCMVSDYQSDTMDIDLTGSTSVIVKYDATGTWINT